ncbi:heparan-sulfate 6-O-sulfotransferase 3 [Erinaceus europaeus]|uniref:Heparan-sulfate 6-O-sulfotransferase n=1 Tax=Erinaceus europaeus TaxID=9365 RepID=A0ABM3XG03_ERIEU|nr:heparan-sulfate 6-O-sulfotransferase 3 [Erinaceus europaeus]
MDERFNKWLLTPVLTLLFVVIMYQYVSPSCSSSCANFGEPPGPPAAAPPSPARRAQAPPDDWERRPQLPPPPRGPPEKSRGATTPDDEDEEPGDPEDARGEEELGEEENEEEEEEEGEDEEEEPDPEEAPENGSLARFAPRFNFTPKDLTRFVDFNIKGRDVIVFLHIQKTGGTTFGRHLVKNIRLEQPCSCKAGQKKCTCHRPGKKETWLFSRFSTGWSCGLHADWTELTNCVPAIMEKKDCPRNHSHTRNFYYITMLRDPVSRYLSEWKHVQRGATWKTSLHMCDGRSPTPDELPTCYPGDDWSGVSLREFMDCTHNLANNRQVRMLADLSLVGCYNLTFMNESERSAILLQSAKNNLKNMAFFGLTEFQRKTQFLFERTFNLQFISPFTQFNITRASNVDISQGARQRIEQLNVLDVQLYDYAKDLFQQRYHHTRQLEHQRDRQRRREERRLQREHRGRGHRGWKGQGQGRPPGGAVTEDYNSQVVRW